MKNYDVIIFDIDNTLIPWEDEYWLSVKEVLEKYNITWNKEVLNKLINVTANYIEGGNYVTKKLYIEELNKDGLKITDQCLEEIFNAINENSPDKVEDEKYEVLDYLQSKYTLVCLTNWFEEAQIERLKKCSLYQYFDNVFGIDNSVAKPGKEAFTRVFNAYKDKSYIIIGDSIASDIKGAHNVGIDSIWYNKNNKENSSENKLSHEIKSFAELKNIL